MARAGGLRDRLEQRRWRRAAHARSLPRWSKPGARISARRLRTARSHPTGVRLRAERCARWLALLGVDGRVPDADVLRPEGLRHEIRRVRRCRPIDTLRRPDIVAATAPPG